jgi:Ca-activated chloride channel family protein
VDTLKYQSNLTPLSKSSYTDELMTVKFRYKAPDGDVSRLIEHPVKDDQISIASTSDNFRFAAAVTEFGLLLRDSEFKGTADFSNVLSLSGNARGTDKEGYRTEFIKLVQSAQTIAKNKSGKKEEVASQ